MVTKSDCFLDKKYMDKNDKELIRFLRENTPYIITTFNKSGPRNLRILKHALNDFKLVDSL